MKYCIENRLDLFSFHDAKLALVSFDGDRLEISAKHLNLHRDAEENPCDFDMEIDTAWLSFAGFEVLSFEPMRKWQVDEDGNWYTDEPQIIFHGKAAEDRLIEGLQKEPSLNCIDIREEGNKTLMEISTFGGSRFFAAFAFRRVGIAWDGYCGKAWYKLHRQYFYDITLETPEGDVDTQAHVICHEEDVYFRGERLEAPVVTIGIQYHGKTFWGGRNGSWVEACAEAQKKLPEGVRMKCGKTCRLENMCPYWEVKNNT